MKKNPKKKLRKKQTQRLPGTESKMSPTPVFDDVAKKGSYKLKDKIAVITGADSGK